MIKMKYYISKPGQININILYNIIYNIYIYIYIYMIVFLLDKFDEFMYIFIAQKIFLEQHPYWSYRQH